MKELIVDNFAGGGGASEGIRLATGRDPDVAVNHDPEAIAMHKANHPGTAHFTADVWDIDPSDVIDGRFGAKQVGLAWFSPDCTHFSKAKGGKPKNKKRRALAWVVVRWARVVKPRVIFLENVEEFADWGPLDNNGDPIATKKGLTFRIWLGKLEAAGYKVEMRQLRACDYGAPTTRKRLFIIARSDGQPIVWPEPTHGPKGSGLLPYRTAAECIDWNLPCPSIFGRKKPLAEKTMARIARGIKKYVLDAARPFIVPTAHGGVGRTDHRVASIDEPLRTITGSRRGDHAVVIPSLIQTSYGERPGQAPRIFDLHTPLTTVVGGGQKHGLVATFLTKHYGGGPGKEPKGSDLREPIDTVTATDHHGLTAAFLSKLYGTSTAASLSDPMPTVTANGRGGGHLSEVRAFLLKYYGQGTGQPLDAPLGTVTTRDRYALGLVTIGKDVYQIADIGMRMLQPRELFRAQSFGDHYTIDFPYKGKPITKTAQIKLVGNSVCPEMAAALIRVNYGDNELRRAA